jgi:hypothetical protein
MDSSVIFLEKVGMIKVGKQYSDGSLEPLGNIEVNGTVSSVVSAFFVRQALINALLSAKFVVVFSVYTGSRSIQTNVYHPISKEGCEFLALKIDTLIGNVYLQLLSHISDEKILYNVKLDGVNLS